MDIVVTDSRILVKGSLGSYNPALTDKENEAQKSFYNL